MRTEFETAMEATIVFPPRRSKSVTGGGVTNQNQKRPNPFLFLLCMCYSFSKKPKTKTKKARGGLRTDGLTGRGFHGGIVGFQRRRRAI